ncbi:MAG: AAA-like domain-containing protein [Oculatellaceae cyanobacterium Prado106]|jgi:hypothetical protein|nr:AAA-like domain-containing protein [Oculatellaceae cyanobacterium Prado106]
MNDSGSPISVEDAIALINTRLSPRQLSRIQEIVFRACWLGLTYHETAIQSGYDEDYLRVIGSRLWQILSPCLGSRRITKSNLHLVLKHYLESPPDESAAPPWSSLSAFATPGSPIPLNSPFYVPRPFLERRACEEILRPHTLVRIKAPRLFGKTTFLDRILAYARAQNYQTLKLNLQRPEQEVFSSLERFLRWFCTSITRQINPEAQFDSAWNNDLGIKTSSSLYLQEHLLKHTNTPVVIGLDEVQRLFEYPHIAQDFLPLLRAWHEEGKQVNLWSRLRFVMAYSTEVYVPLGFNYSPFNVGLLIRLTRFNLEQTQTFVQYYSWSQSVQPDSLIQLHQLVNGHPYLLHLAFEHLANSSGSLEQLLAQATDQTGIYGDHLRGIMALLKRHDALAKTFRQILLAHHPIQIDSRSTYHLESLGLVQLQGDRVLPSCELYRLYFGDRLG